MEDRMGEGGKRGRGIFIVARYTVEIREWKKNWRWETKWGKEGKEGRVFLL